MEYIALIVVKSPWNIDQSFIFSNHDSSTTITTINLTNENYPIPTFILIPSKLSLKKIDLNFF